MNIEDIKAAAVLVVSKLSGLKDIESEEILYRVYREAIDEYFAKTRENTLFNGQKIGEERSVTEEKLEKEIFMSYMFWPSDEEFKTIKTSDNGIINKFLDGINYRHEYLKSKINKSDAVDESTQSKIPIDSEEKNLEQLAKQAVAKHQKLLSEVRQTKAALEKSQAEVARLQSEHQSYVQKAESYKNQSEKYINDLLEKIAQYQSENERLNSKAQQFDSLMPGIRSALENIVDGTEEGLKR